MNELIMTVQEMLEFHKLLERKLGRIKSNTQAEFVEKYCKKGTKLAVEGSWQTGSYTNKDGDKVYTNDCLVDNCEFAESKSTAEQNQKNDNKSGNDDFMNIPDGVEDELPFN